MKKSIALVLFINSILLSDTWQERWTIVICNTKNVVNANTFIQRHVKKNHQKISILKTKSSYITTYGLYDTKEQMNKAYKTLPSHFRKMGAYPLKTKFTLTYPKKINKLAKQDKENLVEQKMTTQNVEKTATVKPKIKIENTNSTNSTNNMKSLMIIPKKQTSDTEKSTSNYNVTIALKSNLFQQTGNIKKGTNGTLVELKDLGIDTSLAGSTSIEVDLSKHKVHASYFTSSIEEKQTNTKNMSLDNYTYTSNQNIATTIKTKWFKGGYRYNYKSLYLGADMHRYIHDTKLATNLANTNIKIDYLFGAVALDMKHTLNSYGIYYGVSYGKKSDLEYADAYASFLIPFSYIDLSIGYDIKQLEIKRDLYESESLYKGAFVEFKKTF